MDKLKIRDQIRAIKWWSTHLDSPLSGYEMITLDVILMNMTRLIEEEDEK